VGGTRTLNANVRIVSATNRNLLDWVDQKQFRLDLYYRLAGIDVTLPPLRTRREDIPALAEVLLMRMAGKNQACRLDKSAINALRHYDFPGNVRELRNLLQRAAVQCNNGLITASDLNLSPNMGSGSLLAPESDMTNQTTASGSLPDLEKSYIRDLLDKHQGHRRTVANLLGITERTLYRKLKQHDLK
jgi:DNA-binding NtrC family response regulator